MPAPPLPQLPALAAIPRPNARNVTLRIDRSGERALRKRHPWLFAEGVRHESHTGEAGDFAVVFDRGRQFLAIGLNDPASPIRVRVLHSGKPTPIDTSFYLRLLRGAAAKRAHLPGTGTNAYRLLNGENEGMPGLVVDRYANTLVLKLYTPAWITHLADVLPALLEVQPAEHVVLRLSRETQGRKQDLHGLADGDALSAAPPPSPVIFEENGLRFECDPRRGQKTGFFLDQRENRARVETLAAGKDVLNVFAYSGGFSLYAARGGASRVTSLDQSRPALAAAERNFALNAGLACRHEVLAADAFTALEAMKSEGVRYGMVVIDPPSFAHRQADEERARSAYARLCRLGLSLLEPGGTFVMASCSARVPESDFFDLILRTAREAGRPLREIARTSHAVDHPIGFREGAYLKCMFARG